MPCIHLVPLSAPRILIVEDEAALADVVSELLVDEGYAVVRARDWLRRRPYDYRLVEQREDPLR